jgi:4-hydroxybenzoate polyprenyltransferase
MTFSRHDSGVVADARALSSQVHPVFMLPPLAASWFGSVLAGEFDVVLGAVHMLAVFLAVYTAHVKDGYVDFYVRDEDDDHPLTERGCRIALALSTAGFLACLGALWLLVGPVAALVTLPCWLIAYLHAPQLDTNPVTATTGYPLGIAVAIVGGHYVQTAGFAAVPVAFAVVFLVLLSGVKVIDDAKDYDYDRSIRKRTVAVVVGRERARTVAFGLMAVGLVTVLAFAAVSVFPPSAAAAVLVFVPVAAFARRGTDELATMLLVRGCYLFLAVLLVAVYYRPLS